jgi:hypothetical protein
MFDYPPLRGLKGVPATAAGETGSRRAFFGGKTMKAATTPGKNYPAKPMPGKSKRGKKK